MSELEIPGKNKPQESSGTERATLQEDAYSESSSMKLAQVDANLPSIFGKLTPMEPCEDNAAYDHIIDELYMRAYDIEGLGDQDIAKAKHDCDIKSDEDALKFADKFLETTRDAHDDLFTAEEITLLRKQAGGRPRSVGFKLQTTLSESNRELETGPILIEHVFAGGSAEKAGLRRGDKINKVDGVDTSERSSIQVEQYIAAHPNEAVKLTVERDGETFDVDLEKTEDKQPAVRGEMDGDIAYIKIDSFMSSNLSQELKTLLEELKDARAFVVDVRDNLGGHLTQGIEASTLFVDDGLIVKTRERERSNPEDPKYKQIEYGVTQDQYYERTVGADGKTTEILKERLPDLVDKPVRVLTNGYSASASEIFASALQENGDAKVVGVRSLGKGDGQTIAFGFPHGSALKYTSFRYYSPDGKWFGDGKDQRIGITPDLSVANQNDSLRYSPEDTQYQIALRSIRAELDRR